MIRVAHHCSLMLLVVLLSLPCATCFAQEAIPAPDFLLKSIDDRDIGLASNPGKVIILNFWATWCPPCREEIPNLVDIFEANKEKGVEIIGISIDRDIEKVREFATINKITYPIALAEKSILEAYGGIQAVPTTFVIDSNHAIVNKFIGFQEKITFETEISKLLAPPPEVQPPSKVGSAPDVGFSSNTKILYSSTPASGTACNISASDTHYSYSSSTVPTNYSSASSTVSSASEPHSLFVPTSTDKLLSSPTASPATTRTTTDK
ncbi:MAG: TlpA family protein disulfide reductase [Candidatus Riflebacteria bacterium]|nr:TlpA family protein disulfide reductase [Candidatus Riflebacteria bacterium]